MNALYWSKIPAATLEQNGTPWAECYRGSGRLTGRLAARPQYCLNGGAAPNWQRVGNMTEADFYTRFEWEQHDHCHSRPEDGCRYCEAME